MGLQALYARFRRRRLYRRCLDAPSRVLILRYHSVGAPSEVATYLDPGLSVTPERFREQVRALARRFRFALPHQVPALLEREAAAPSRERVAVITFDDGYRDNHDLAAPILRDEGAVAAFYVTTTPLTSGHGLWISELYRLVPRLPPGPLVIDGAPALAVPGDTRARTPLRRALTRWLSTLVAADRERALDALASLARVPRGEGLGATFMTPVHLRALRDMGMVIGAHTRSHPHLDRLAPALHADEVSGSRRDLEQILGEPVDAFAYPNPGGGGEALPPARLSVEKAGFRTAVTSTPDPLTPGCDALRLPRVGVYAGAQEQQLFAMIEELPPLRGLS